MIEIDSMSILIIDDMKSMRLTIRKMLQTLEIGGNLQFAKNGKEGLEILNRAQCDLAVIDWNMPVMNGIDMLNIIRKNKSYRDLPVIMITAESERDIVSEVAETEVDAYLLKPLTLAALDEKIRKVVKEINYPGKSTIHRLKARDFEENGDVQEAISQLKKALGYRPNASRLLRKLGLLYFKQRKNSVALKCLLKAVSVNKHDVISRIYLADYYIKKDDHEKAVQYFLEIMSLTSKYNDKALEFAAKLLKGSKSMAFTIFSRILIGSKKQNITREKIINICIKNDEITYALSLLEDSIKEAPSNYELIFQAGILYEKLNNIEKAFNCFFEIDRHIRGHVQAKLHLAKIYIDQNKVIQADACLNQILRIDPKNEKALDLRRKF